MAKKNEGFSSIIGFILVAIGLALGIGSLWRFPYIVGENGGAIFIFMYIAIILIIGIPLMTAEITIGYATQKTAIAAYQELAPKRKWYLAGYLHLTAALLILGYTSPIYAWIVKYVFASIQGSFTGLSPEQVVKFFEGFSDNKNMVFLFFVVNLFLNILVITFGVQNGIERISKILLPLLFGIMTIIIVRALNLEGAREGLLFLFKPDPSKFTLNSVISCLGQAFFALGLAMLGSMVFGSYIKDKNENIFKSASVVCISLIFAGLAAGLMILPIVFATGLKPEQGVALTFLTLPNAFNLIPGGRFLSILFYFGFYIAAFTSSVGVLEAVVGLFIEKFDISRIKAILIAVVIILVISYLSINYNSIFNFFDKIESNFILVIGCFIIAIFCGYVWGIDNTINAANIKSPFIKTWMILSLKYISPIAIVVIFITQFIRF
ncbi:sodium-dependent transporter [Peptoniphilus mikwangii]|uniref:sodium-dependent transporter n=1 Tax=Peptoniphilus mikwangii TaxID=1354300 RepID=UPI000404CCC9|nr:sodium-dependent transporter [Peptoniphilus mikwangii]